jgi:hypothetical protein
MATSSAMTPATWIIPIVATLACSKWHMLDSTVRSLHRFIPV